jgi:5-methyltetrahydrofolate--homocysteine methyltransferase
MIGLSGLITPSLEEMAHNARDMQREGYTIPLLIGGATTSRQHTAVRIAPAYSKETVHVLDASRVVGVVSDLLDGERRVRLDVENRELQERLRTEHAARDARPLFTLAQARANRLRPDFGALAEPPFTGRRLVEPSLDELIPYIDWQFLFLAWDLKGKFPKILERPEARELYDDALALLPALDLTARGVYGYWPAHEDGDDVVVGDTTFHFLRQQATREDSRPNLCLSDYVAPEGDHVGAFAVGIHGADEVARSYEEAHDDYRAIMAKALADRLAEAFAEWLHAKARREWYAPDEQLAPEELVAERFAGIRPAFGYPACPDHTEKAKLFALLDAGEAGLELTESFATLPGASVSGIYLANAAARYFSVGRIGRDQLADYAERKGIDPEEAERWLRPVL